MAHARMKTDMNDNDILSLEQAARLVHATPKTLTQYIHGGELPATRIGKTILIVYAALVDLVNNLAARQQAERQAKRLGRERSNGIDVKPSPPGAAPMLVQFEPRPKASKRGGRRRPLPPLPPEKS